MLTKIKFALNVKRKPRFRFTLEEKKLVKHPI